MQTPAASAASTGEGPGNAGKSEACTNMTLPTRRWRKACVSRAGSTSSKMTSKSACSSSMSLSNWAEKSAAAISCSAEPTAPPAPPAPASSWKRPPPSTMSFTPADLAKASALLSGFALATAATIEAEAGNFVAFNRACIGVTSAAPARTMTRSRETDQASCSEDSTCGKGSDTPSSGNINHAPCAPSISRRGAPAGQAARWPTTTGSSCNCASSASACSCTAAGTTRTMPRPQLKVEINSWHGTLPTPASQRSTAGSSHVSACNCALSRGGSTVSKPCSKPPRATCAAPFKSPARASASTAFA
mmetsp:Transcript_70072/g.200817  ORF Transcript_70072/g.200817 Transcript_70072/m.200817 type:complete len:304 (-) Transcript_70072:2558-3469(-)